MRIHPKGIAVLIGASAFLALGASSGGGWFHATEALASIVIALGIAGALSATHATHPRV